MPLLYYAYVYLEFLILACTIYILAPDTSGKMVTTRTILNLNSSEDEETQYLETWYPLDNGLISKKDVEIEY